VTPVEIVDTPAQARALDLPPLLVIRPLEDHLAAHGLGRGPLRAERIGDGQSNVTFLVRLGDERLVLRRPPRPPLPPSAHDVLREARIVSALERAGARVPHIRLVCDDAAVLGVPFYVMDELEGEVLGRSLPPALDRPGERRRIGEELVDALAEVHDVDLRAAGLDGLSRAGDYLERQLRRFTGLWEVNATRELPAFAEVAAWLEAHRPASGPETLVHGEYRLGNVLFAPGAPARLSAVLDWELAAVGDPLADVGYLLATYSDAGSPGTVMERSPVTRRPGFPDRGGLAARYAARTGRGLAALTWYEALAHWKAAVFCEAIYGRWRRGERPREDPFGRSLERGVPGLLEAARACAARR
jgi:aminoglycoside phosphotransferase (APT) family kinase protein